MFRKSLMAAIAALTFSMPGFAGGHEVTAGDLIITHPAARPNLPNRPTAAYMVISNDGQNADRLIAASSPAFGRIELHLSSRKNGVMTMEMVPGIDVPEGGAAELKPGGYHIMLFDADALLKDGDMFPMTLTFEQAGDVEIKVMVDKRINAGGHGGHGGHGAKHGDGHGHKKAKE